MKTTFADRMRLAMDRAGLKPIELHEKTGISKPSISEYLSGNYEPKQRNLYKIAKALGVQPSYLMGITPLEPPAPPAASEKPHKRGGKIPVLGHVAAGVPIYAEENIIDWEEISEEQARSGEYFALRVSGQSMEPTIHDGDTLIIRKQEQVENGEIAVVLVNGDEATVKEIHEDAAGLTLVGHNVAVYKPTLYTPRQIEELPVRIIGRVVQSRHDF